MNTALGNGQQPRAAGAPQAFVLIFAMLMPIASLMAMVPNLPQFFQHFADVPSKTLLVPMILTIPALCNALLSPFVGALADRFGRRPLFLAALLIHFAFGASAFFLHSLYAILATRVAVGIAEATIMTLANALLGDYYTQGERQKWLAYQSIVGSIMATGLVLLGGFLGTLSWSSPFLVHLLSLIMFAVSFVFIFEPRGTAHHAAEAHSGRAAGFPVLAMAIVCGVSLVCSCFYFVQTIQLGRIFESFGVESSGYIGVAMTLASLGVITGGILYRKLASRIVAQLLAVVFGFYAVGMTSLALADTLFLAVPLAMVAQVGNGMMIPILVAWALGTLPFAHRGRGMGLWNSAFYAVGMTSLALADTLFLAVPLAIVAQVGNGMMIPILVAWALGTLPFAHRGRGMGLWNSAFYIGNFLSPVFVAFVAASAGQLMDAILWIGLACFVMSLLALVGLRAISPLVRAAAEPVPDLIE